MSLKVIQLLFNTAESLEHVTAELFQSFSNNQMKTNVEKCHFTTSKRDDIVNNTRNNRIKNSKCGKLIGVKTDFQFPY